MFLKLFKYDFKYYIKKMIPFFILSLAMALLTMAFNLFATYSNNNKEVLLIIDELAKTIFSLYLSILSTYSIVIVILRFVNNVFKDEGYLTHTLPVSKHQILLSKYLLFFVNLLIVAVVLLAASYLASIPNGNDVLNTIFFDMKSSWKEVEKLFAIYPLESTVTLITIIIAMVASVSLFSFSFALGYSKNKHKGLKSIILYFAFNYGITFIVSAYIIALTSASSGFSSSLYWLIILPILAGALLVLIGGYFLSIHLMSKKLNLE